MRLDFPYEMVARATSMWDCKNTSSGWMEEARWWQNNVEVIRRVTAANKRVKSVIV